MKDPGSWGRLSSADIIFPRVVKYQSTPTFNRCSVSLESFSCCFATHDRVRILGTVTRIYAKNPVLREKTVRSSAVRLNITHIYVNEGLEDVEHCQQHEGKISTYFSLHEYSN
jgi:hypothetical protein